MATVAEPTAAELAEKVAALTARIAQLEAVLLRCTVVTHVDGEPITVADAELELGVPLTFPLTDATRAILRRMAAGAPADTTDEPRLPAERPRDRNAAAVARLWDRRRERESQRFGRVAAMPDGATRKRLLRRAEQKMIACADRAREHWVRAYGSAGDLVRLTRSERRRVVRVVAAPKRARSRASHRTRTQRAAAVSAAGDGDAPSDDGPPPRRRTAGGAR